MTADDRFKPGRFFNDLNALDAEVKRFTDAAAAIELPESTRNTSESTKTLYRSGLILRALVMAYGNVIGRRTLALHDEHADRIAELEARIGQLEAQPFHFDGPHEAGKTYTPRTFVSRNGSLWHCNRTTDTTPGDGGPAWTLAVKAGRDAR